MRGLPDSDLVALAISGERFAFGELALSPRLQTILLRTRF
jgi:hypothetical protein